MMAETDADLMCLAASGMQNSSPAECLASCGGRRPKLVELCRACATRGCHQIGPQTNRDASSLCTDHQWCSRAARKLAQSFTTPTTASQQSDASSRIGESSNEMRVALKLTGLGRKSRPLPVNAPVLVLFLSLASNISQVRSFWLTDSSLLRSLEPAILQDQPANGTKSAGWSSDQVAAAAPNVSDPWIPVDLIGPRQQPACQCSPDWLQNQTIHWLNKWLHSSQVVGQMRLLVSNSTGAINRRRDAKHHQQQLHPAGDNGNHWPVWHRGLRGQLAHNVGQVQQNVNKSHGGRLHSRVAADQQQQQQQLLLQQAPVALRGDRGPEGPKGEQGARGERGEPGPSGLISVKDRDSLFDLAQQLPAGGSDAGGPMQKQSASSGDDNKQSARRLVFIEAEQMLVLNTNSGWRPVQLLAPIRDFRRTIAKFNLNSAEERRRLMSTENMDNSIRVPGRPSGRREGVSSRLPGARLGQGANGLALVRPEPSDETDPPVAPGGDPVTSVAIEGGDELDEDEDEDDDDELDDDDESDDMTEEDDDDASRAAADQKSSKRGSNGHTRRAPQVGSLVSGRSPAAASLVSAPDDGSGSMMQAMARPKTSQADAPRPHPAVVSNDRRMKLRIAALNAPFPGNIHGIRGADFECKQSALRAHMKGSFRALLASGYQNLNEVVRANAHKHPIVNLRGETLANSWHDLFKQPARLTNPLSRIYSFDGRHVATDSNWPNKLVWHGAETKTGRDSIHNCDGWHSDSLTKFGMASPLHSPRLSSGRRKQKRRHLDNLPARREAFQQGANSTASVGGLDGSVFESIEKYPCRMPLIVLCVETIGQSSEPIGPFRSDESNNLVAY